MDMASAMAATRELGRPDSTHFKNRSRRSWPKSSLVTNGKTARTNTVPAKLLIPARLLSRSREVERGFQSRIISASRIASAVVSTCGSLPERGFAVAPAMFARNSPLRGVERPCSSTSFLKRRPTSCFSASGKLNAPKGRRLIALGNPEARLSERPDCLSEKINLLRLAAYRFHTASVVGLTHGFGVKESPSFTLAISTETRAPKLMSLDRASLPNSASTNGSGQLSWGPPPSIWATNPRPTMGRGKVQQIGD